MGVVPEKKGYEVIRFIERGKKCYTSIDFVKGSTLYTWINKNNKIDKDTLQRWLQEILKQLLLFHKQQRNPDYRFLNPYNIIITGKKGVVLRSVEEAAKNVDEFVEKYFVPQNKTQNRDVYCYGKIIQFIMAHIQCEPYLTKTEEYQLLKIVRKCLSSDSQNQYQSIQEIQNNFIKKKQDKNDISQIKFRKSWGIKVAVIVLAAASIFIFRRANRIHEQYVEVVEVEEKKTTEKETVGYFDIGLSYFLELKNYAKSREYFMKAQDEDVNAKYYVELSDFMLKHSLDMDVTTALEVLQSNLTEGNDIREVLVLIRVYALLDREEAYQAMIDLGEKTEEQSGWNMLDENLKKEFYEYRALAYEKLQLWDNAIASYRNLFQLEQGESDREQIYLKLIELYTKMNEIEKVEDTCKKGMKELTQSTEICVKYIESLWLNPDMDDAARLEEIQKITSEKPGIVVEESFIRLMETKRNTSGGRTDMDGKGP